MKLIEQNPFRVLGIAINATAKELAANMGKKKLLDIGKDVVLPLDLPSVFPPINRTSETMEAAKIAINLPQDKVRHALFWFAQPTSPIGKLGYQRLLDGDKEDAIAKLQRGTSWEESLCLSVLYLQDGRYYESIRYIENVISNHTNDFCMAIDGTYKVSADELRQIYLHELTSEIDVIKVLEAIEGDAALHSFADQLRQSAVSVPVKAIDDALAKAKAVPDDNAYAQLKAGNDLIEATKSPLATLKKLVGGSDIRYSRLADKVANQILQCSITYHNVMDNATDEPLSVSVINDCLNLAEYAEKLCVGRIAKERITKNANILREKKKNLPPAEVETETAEIMKALRVFIKQPDKIEHSVTLLNKTKPHLQSIKSKLGATNPYYLKLSTQIVGNALHNLIEEVNAAQESETFEYKGQRVRISSEKTNAAVKAAWRCTQMMEDFDMESDFRTNRFNPNRDTLRSMYNSISGGTSTGDWGTGGGGTGGGIDDLRKYLVERGGGGTGGGSTGGGDGTNWGCIIQIAIAIIFFIIYLANQ